MHEPPCSAATATAATAAATAGPTAAAAAAAAVVPKRNKAGNKKAGKKRWTWKKPVGKPKRPLSAYNIFFRYERERLLCLPDGSALDGGGDGEDDLPPAAESAEEITVAVSRMIGESASSSSSSAATRKPHRRGLGGGKIGFANLARTIADRWKNLDRSTRTIFEAAASIEKRRYREDIDKWNAEQVLEAGEAKEKGKDRKGKEEEAATEIMIARMEQPPIAAAAPAAASSSAARLRDIYNSSSCQSLAEQLMVMPSHSSSGPSAAEHLPAPAAPAPDPSQADSLDSLLSSSPHKPSPFGGIGGEYGTAAAAMSGSTRQPSMLQQLLLRQQSNPPVDRAAPSATVPSFAAGAPPSAMMAEFERYGQVSTLAMQRLLRQPAVSVHHHRHHPAPYSLLSHSSATGGGAFESWGLGHRHRYYQGGGASAAAAVSHLLGRPAADHHRHHHHAAPPPPSSWLPSPSAQAAAGLAPPLDDDRRRRPFGDVLGGFDDDETVDLLWNDSVDSLLNGSCSGNYF